MNTKLQQKILNSAAKVFDVTPAALLSPARNKQVSEARFAAVYFFRLMTTLYIPQIATAFRRDYDTIRHAVRRAKDLIAIDHKFAARMGEVEKLIRSK